MLYRKDFQTFGLSEKGERELAKSNFEDMQSFLKLIKYINLEIRKFMFSLSRDTDKTTLEQSECENQKREQYLEWSLKKRI